MSKWILRAPSGHPQDYDRGLSDHTWDSDNSISVNNILELQMVEI